MVWPHHWARSALLGASLFTACIVGFGFAEPIKEMARRVPARPTPDIFGNVVTTLRANPVQAGGYTAISVGDSRATNLSLGDGKLCFTGGCLSGEDLLRAVKGALPSTRYVYSSTGFCGGGHGTVWVYLVDDVPRISSPPTIPCRNPHWTPSGRMIEAQCACPGESMKDYSFQALRWP